MEENLGKKLRRSREAAGLTIDDAVYRARMPRAVVEALEADDYGFFSSPLYARSFLKQYGDYVGQDVSAWIDDLVPTTLIDGEAGESFLEIEEPAVVPIIRERKREAGGGGAMAAVWLFLITGGLIWGGMVLFKGFEQKHTAAPVPSVPVEVEKISEETEPPPEEIVTTQEAEPPRRAIIVREEE